MPEENEENHKKTQPRVAVEQDLNPNKENI
jgi:hypothetical protein